MAPNRALSALGCVEYVANERSCVAIAEDVVGEFDALDERKKARLTRIMELWRDNHRLTKEQFNGNEGREQLGTINVLIQAFKTHKNRLYGYVAEIDGRRTFVMVAIDPAKKQDKADPIILKRAKSRAVEIEKARLAFLNQQKSTGKAR